MAERRVEMEKSINDRHVGLILRIFTGTTVLFWGYEKLVLEKLTKLYVMDYGPFMVFDVDTFLQFGGWIQILLAALVLLGIGTRYTAVIFALMGIVTILIPGVIIMKDVPHFAYAFAFTGASIALWITGGGPYSMDGYIGRRRATHLARLEHALTPARVAASTTGQRHKNSNS